MLQRQNWTFHVSQNNDALAFSVPSGIVIVSEQMLGLLRTDDQLAFILAHEIGHLIARHGGESITRCAPTEMWKDAAMYMLKLTEDWMVGMRLQYYTDVHSAHQCSTDCTALLSESRAIGMAPILCQCC